MSRREPRKQAPQYGVQPQKGATVQPPSITPSKGVQGDMRQLHQSIGNCAVNHTLEISDAESDLLRAVEQTLENVQHGRVEYPKTYGSDFPYSGIEVLADIIFAATEVTGGTGLEQTRRLARARAVLRPILERLIHADPLAGPQYVRESIETPLAKLEGRVHAEGIVHRAEAEAQSEGMYEWLTPAEVEQQRELCAQTRACIDELSGALHKESGKEGENIDSSVKGDRTAAKIVQAVITKKNREVGADLGAGNKALSKGAPSAIVVGLAVLSHAKAALDFVDQALILRASMQRPKAQQGPKKQQDARTIGESVSGLFDNVNNALLLIEAAVSASVAVMTAVYAGRAIVAKISFADFVKAASSNVVRTGFLVSGARITGMLNVVGVIRGALKAANSKSTLQERGEAVRDALSGLVGAIRYVHVPFEVAASAAATANAAKLGLTALELKETLAYLGKVARFRGATAGAATGAIWIAWLEFEAGRFVLENAPKAVGRLIDYDIVHAFNVIREEGFGLETQLKVALALAEAMSKAPNDDSPRTQGLRDVYDEALGELRRRTAHAYNASAHDGGTNTPGHYAKVRDALRSVDSETVHRGLATNALPEETILAALAVLNTIRQAWSTYDSVRKDARIGQYADKPSP